MKVLVRMPNWIGDAVMATPALDNLRQHFDGAEFVLVGAPVVADMFRQDPRFLAVAADPTKKQPFRTARLWQLGRRLRAQYGPFDLGWSFANGFSSRVLLRASGAGRRVSKRHAWHDCLLTDTIAIDRGLHETQRYQRVVNGYLGTDYPLGPPMLSEARPHPYARPTAAISPGAGYGDAKRWLPERFVEVAVRLSSRFDILILGASAEQRLTGEIETHLRAAGVHRLQNATGCPMSDLLSLIAGLDLLLTNDSGPLHIGVALGIPTVAIFGATSPNHTFPWDRPHARLVRHELPCAPCAKRTCPRQHHACMSSVTAREVVDVALALVDTQAARRRSG
jgi:heptosyltransferase II